MLATSQLSLFKWASEECDMSESKKFSDYIKSMIEIYAELRAQQSGNITHRLADYRKNVKGEYEVTVQLTGKVLAFKTTPKQILADDSLLESFSKKDIRLLTYLACEDIKEPTHEILGQKFVRTMNKFFFKLKHGKTGEEMEKSAEEISSDPEIIKLLSPEDAHKIGYVTANEQFKQEKDKK